MTRIAALALFVGSLTAQDRRVFWTDHLMVVVSPAGQTASRIVACAYDSMEIPEGYAGPMLAVYARESVVVAQLAESGQACWAADVAMASRSISHVRAVEVTRDSKRGAQ